jgi:hypothetical protein
MIEIWNEFDERGVNLDTPEYEARLYQGLKIVRDEDGYRFLSTENDFYPTVRDEIIGVFFEEGFDAGIKAYKKDKYLRQLEEFRNAKYMTAALTRKLENL